MSDINPEYKDKKAFEIEEVGKIVHDVFDEGVRFIVMRGPAAYCAYVGVPNEHPLAGFGYDDIGGVDAHGGLTFSGGGKQWPEGYYWYGWDYAHLGDVSVYDHKYKDLGGPSKDEHDWTLEEVVKDSWSALYDFKKLMRLAERIKAKI